jgi:hypothetical protein
MKREDIIQNLLYGILLSAFLVLYFLLSMNSRLAADDFYFLKNFDLHGVWQSMVISWHSWVTRWASILWLNMIFGLFRLTGNFLFFHIITLLMLCFALFRLSSFSIDCYLNGKSSSSKTLKRLAELPRHSRFAVLLLISFFFLVPSPGETFFWVTSSSMYLWALIACCFLFAEIIRGSRTFISISVCMITSAFIGGASEAVALPAFMILLLISIYQSVRKNFKVSTFLALIVLLASIIISYMGEGRSSRQSSLPHFGLIESMLITIKSIAHGELYFLKGNLLWAALLFISWTGFAARLSLQVQWKPKFVLYAAGIYAFLCLLFIFPACYLLGEIPPWRAWILISLLNCFVISLGGILTGAGFKEKKIVNVASSLAVVMLTILVAKTAVEQKQVTGEYARAVDSRMQFLTTLVDPQDSSTIILENYPPSGLLTSSEIGTDTADFRNRHLKNYLGIKANLRVK